MSTKLRRVVTYSRNLPLINHLTLWIHRRMKLRNKLKILYLHYHNAYSNQTWKGDYIQWEACFLMFNLISYVSTTTRRMAIKLELLSGAYVVSISKIAPHPAVWFDKTRRIVIQTVYLPFNVLVRGFIVDNNPFEKHLNVFLKPLCDFW